MEEMKFSRRGEWWRNVVYPARSVWVGVATRLGFRKSGLLKLRHEVSTCEYEDIHVMWEMLNRNESELGHYPDQKSKKRRHYLKFFTWARCAPYIRHS